MQALLQRAQVSSQLRENRLLLRSHVRRRLPRRIQFRQLVASSGEQVDELPLVLTLPAIGNDGAGLAALRQPPPQSIFLHGHGESLVELRVVLYVEELVRELVENRCRQLILAIAKHRAQHRIGELPQC